MQRRNAKSDDDTAEHTHLQCLDTAHTRHRSVQHVLRDRSVRKDISLKHEHGVDGDVHNEEGDHCRKGSYFLLFLRHSDGNSHREDQRQVVEDNTSRFAHDREQSVKYCAVSENGLKPVCLDHCRIGKRASDSEQKSCHRKDRDGKHKASSDSLQYSENFVFHLFSSFFHAKKA